MIRIGMAESRDAPRCSYLLPPEITGAISCSQFGAAGVHRNDRVYLTTAMEGALMYAASVKNGVIYQCGPVGELEPDPDCSDPGLSWQCEKARVIKVFKPKPQDIALARSVLLSEISA